jgi:cytochrome c biogenesis protein CcmG/thiol:disulfide interchange protein DsbE
LGGRRDSARPGTAKADIIGVNGALLKKNLKRNALTGLVLAGIVLLMWLFASPLYRQGEPSLAGKPAHDFAFTLDGKPASLADLRGKVVVLNFWATWCPPCVEEAPALNQLQQAVVSQGGMILGISVDEDDEAYKKFLVDHSIVFPTYRDPSKQIAAAYGSSMFPETYIIDRRGRIARKIIGPQDWASPEMVAYLRDLMKNND